MKKFLVALFFLISCVGFGLVGCSPAEEDEGVDVDQEDVDVVPGEEDEGTDVDVEEDDK